MSRVSYGFHKTTKRTYKCRQDIGDVSLYQLDGTFEEALAHLESKRVYYQKWITDGGLLRANYLGGEKDKKVKFEELEIQHEKNEWGDGSILVVYGYRDLDEEEEAIQKAQIAAVEEKNKEARRLEYERLRKEFE